LMVVLSKVIDQTKSTWFVDSV